MLYTSFPFADTANSIHLRQQEGTLDLNYVPSPCLGINSLHCIGFTAFTPFTPFNPPPSPNAHTHIQLSYLHICFQPVSITTYILRLEPNKDVARLAVRLGLLAGALGALRLPYLGLGYIPDWFRLRWLPGLPDPAQAGGAAVCGWEFACGPVTCTYRGPLHLAWSLPLMVRG
jgi:hypothetical protein